MQATSLLLPKWVVIFSHLVVKLCLLFRLLDFVTYFIRSYPQSSSNESSNPIAKKSPFFLLSLLKLCICHDAFPGEPVDKLYSCLKASVVRDAAAKALYARMFQWIISRSNSHLEPKSTAKDYCYLDIGMCVYNYVCMCISLIRQGRVQRTVHQPTSWYEAPNIFFNCTFKDITRRKDYILLHRYIYIYE